ncbi:MEDS domain-containing protein [Candidatus Omnitrophota bacterium]
MKKKSANNGNVIRLKGALDQKHICLFYETVQDLSDLLIPFFKEGLKKNNFCLWITSEVIGVEAAKEKLGKEVENLDSYIKNGQLEIIDYKNWYLKAGKLNTEETLTQWGKKGKKAQQKGFRGMRISGDVSWLRKEDWQEWVAYEEKIDKLLDEDGVTALCTYPIANHDVVDMFILSDHHRLAFSNKNKQWHVLKNV